MTPAIIISRYADPDIAMRRRNVREAMGTCRWAVAQGYAPVCSLIHLADVNDPPEDTAGEVRDRVMEYSTTLARMVGAAGGVAIVPGWYPVTWGMESDFVEWRKGCVMNVRPVAVTLAEIEPYLPRDLVGRVQSAVDHLYECEAQADGGGDWAFREALDSIDHHTGVTPTATP